ncbi:MAG TPA: glycoside hydrolase family 97 protein [Tenuifilaceae bacterium]|nr:glycoside hydrolase family 97 protein [Tenuifilaceae bacterium]HPE17243.1 glycoside hydrolase family 97 protein [Tenuifilaceae bacterium]HPJ44470.1 glycoside hydrolase family 97 protein [Tenuifilaceae bacterium]HPQ33008.1 glycoside hydrolase family 97 protein [Tenuifilaceae bacterium]HRX67939.1 glycoside hydrolase family 97 protein [Tenuifilaceae bacterium]
MKKIKFTLLLFLAAFCLFSCKKQQDCKVKSPSGDIMVELTTLSNGQAAYFVKYKNKSIIDTSTLGFEFTNAPKLSENLKIVKSEKNVFSEIWEMPWGEQRFVDNTYNQLVVTFKEMHGEGREFAVEFRVYNDGLGFRYFFPEQKNMGEVLIADEKTQFNLTGNHKCWWIPGDWDIYEHLYSETLLSEIDAIKKRNHPNLGQTYIPENAVNTPVTMKTDDGLYLTFHEAALVNYAGMTLKVDTANFSMCSNLVGSDRTSYKVEQHVPFHTPWRTIQVAEKAGDLIESKLILNLNEPNKLGDVSWVKPTKYVGIWWEMHLDKASWDMASGRHGATTANAKRYIDFAAQNNIGAILVEGWNTGWEHWIGFEDREGVFDFVTPYADYDLPEVVRYGKEKGVRLIMHHETSSAVTTYDQQLDTAYALMNKLGIEMVKTGYVGKIIPKGEYHHGQWMVNHYARVIQAAAKYKVAVNSHEPIKATGLRRTYPNEISREGLRGQEFNAWASDGGNPPNHLPTVTFTRMLAGPIDYTPGIFNIKLNPYKKDNQVNTTLAHQLALYVVIYSPIQMAADLPEHYENHPAFQFISDVGVDWEQTKVLNGEIGQFVTIAREECETGNWFLGSITNGEAREIVVKTDFLQPGLKYAATIYEDGEDAHWDKNPTSYKIKNLTVDSSSELSLTLAPGGGAAVSFIVQK